MLTKFLSPKNDLAFKRIFGTERNKDILIHFLNDIFGRTINPIEEVSFLNSSLDPEVAALRASIVDVLCQDTEGNRFIVEMQVSSEKGFEKRAQYYAAKTYIDQRGTGVEYANLKEVTFLAILDFTLLPDKTEYLSHHVVLDKHTLQHDLKDFSFSFLELPKFKKTKGELTTLTEKWAYFFKKANITHEQDLPVIVGNDTIIQKAYEELNRFSWTPEEIRAYDSVEMKQMADRAVLEAAKSEGKQETFLLLLQQKFKEIPESYQIKVKEADSDRLNEWITRLLGSKTLQEVFKE
jgi:predicted transposase/invertase (TIGR01784 family)